MTKRNPKSNLRQEFQFSIITIHGHKILLGDKVDIETENILKKNGYEFILKNN